MGGGGSYEHSAKIGQKMVSDSSNGESKGLWALQWLHVGDQTGPLEEQQISLSSGPSLQPPL